LNILFLGYFLVDGTETVQVTIPNPNVLVAISKDMWTVKLCSNKILQFFTTSTSLCSSSSSSSK